MSISFITPRNIYNFSYPNWDELRTAYIQTFNSFLGDWIDKKKMNIAIVVLNNIHIFKILLN
jgi:hypothetical protein